MLEIVAFGRTVLSIGMMTVGPVTTIIAPNNSDNDQEKSRMKCVAKVIHPQVIATPIVSILRTTFCSPRISWNLSVRLPSNKIIATANETIGNSNSPNSCSGFNQPVSGPSIIPAINKNTIAGNFTHHANH